MAVAGILASHYTVVTVDCTGTASVAVAGILASLQLTGKKLEENVFVFQGAGEVCVFRFHCFYYLFFLLSFFFSSPPFFFCLPLFSSS